MRFPIVLACVLASAAVANAQENQILFETPKDAADAQRTQAAKSLAARCVAAGMKDAKGDTISRGLGIPRQVRLQSRKGFSKEDLDAIAWLSNFPARTFEMRFEYFLTGAEKQKYEFGVEAPPGRSWIKYKTWEESDKTFPRCVPSKEDLFAVYHDKPVIDLTGRCAVLRHPGGDLHGSDLKEGIYLVFRDAVVKMLRDNIVPDPDKPGKTILPANIFIDGARLPTEDGMMGWRITKPKGKDPDYSLWTFPMLTPESSIAVLLEHPLPFPLKRIE